MDWPRSPGLPQAPCGELNPGDSQVGQGVRGISQRRGDSICETVWEKRISLTSVGEKIRVFAIISLIGMAGDQRSPG